MPLRARHRLLLAALTSAAVTAGARDRALAQSAPWSVADQTTIRLTDGSLVTGVVTRVNVGVDITMRLAGGIDRTIPWSEVAVAGPPPSGDASPSVRIGPVTNAPMPTPTPTPAPTLPPSPPPPPFDGLEPRDTAYREPRPGTLPVVIEHEGRALEVARITGSHTETEPYSNRYGTTFYREVVHEDTSSLCVTPCTLYLPERGATLHFGGEGLLASDLTLSPRGRGERVRVAGATVFRPFGGFLLAFFAVPLAIAGTVLTGFAVSDVTSATPSLGGTGTLAIGLVTLGIGAPLATLGIYLMATGRTRIVHREPLRAGLLGASIAPSATGHGALAGVAFAF